MRVTIWSFCLVTALFCTGACVDPENRYFDEILKAGYIPFKHPMANVGTGMIVRGSFDELLPLAPPSKCFPYSSSEQPNDLRWYSDSDLPNTHFAARLDFNAKINTIAQAGTPSLNFKFQMQAIRSVDMDIQGATVEMFDHVSLQDYIHDGLSDSCREYLNRYPFILNALEVTQMTFVFLDLFNGEIQLSVDNIEQIVDFEAGVKWHIENGYKLVVNSSKFIGYHLAQLRPEDDGFIRLIATEIDQNGQFFFKEYFH